MKKILMIMILLFVNSIAVADIYPLEPMAEPSCDGNIREFNKHIDYNIRIMEILSLGYDKEYIEKFVNEPNKQTIDLKSVHETLKIGLVYLHGIEDTCPVEYLKRSRSALKITDWEKNTKKYKE